MNRFLPLLILLMVIIALSLIGCATKDVRSTPSKKLRYRQHRLKIRLLHRVIEEPNGCFAEIVTEAPLHKRTGRSS